MLTYADVCYMIQVLAALSDSVGASIERMCPTPSLQRRTAVLLVGKLATLGSPMCSTAYVSIRQHTSAYVSIPSHTRFTDM
jgi:hypothetical protein